MGSTNKLKGAYLSGFLNFVLVSPEVQIKATACDYLVVSCIVKNDINKQTRCLKKT
jgi:hypothetical protein